VKALVDAAYNRTLAILKSRRSVLEHGARLLLEKETLGEDDLRKLMAEDRPAAAQ
jgi:cell division protease FtsH